MVLSTVPGRGQREWAIQLLDIAQIEAGACECHQTVKGHYERLLAI